MTTVRGTARSQGPSYQSVITADPVPPPASLRVESCDWPGDNHIDPRRYTSREFAGREA